MYALKYCYECPPIDFWGGWQTLDINSFGLDSDEPFGEFNMLVEELEDTIRGFKTFWEGDGQWRFSGLPHGEVYSNCLMFAIKQQNNGITYVLSPFKLPWLAEYQCEKS